MSINVLFLDQKLNVRRFTERASQIINLRENDVGRSLSDLTTSPQYPKLNEDARETLRTPTFSEKQILTSDERWFEVRNNVTDGAVITFVDIAIAKRL